MHTTYHDQRVALPPTSSLQNFLRIFLGLFLITTGSGHLTWARVDFRSQVPEFVPMDTDLVVVLSGIVEILLGACIALVHKYRGIMGWIAAAFFVAVFPGNIAQLVNHRSGFGLDTDSKRAARLLLQPVFIAWALWSTGAWWAKRI